MSSSQDIQNCINQCNQLANQLRSLGKTMNQQQNQMLDEAAHHIDLCITECQFSLQKAKQAEQPRVTVTI